MRQRTSTGASALLAVALGATLSLGPTAALAEVATAQPAEAPEQQVTVRDVESEDSIVPTWKQGWVLADDGTWYWGLPDGTFAKDEWVYAGGSWYLMDADGSMLTGKALKDGVWYYLTSSGAMATGWAQDADGYWYLASTDAADGRLQTGWQKVNDSWYWLDPATGKMATGWLEQGGSTYYLSAPNGNMLASAWVDDENGHRWLGSDGALVATVSGTRIVYADASHAPASGLTTIGDAVYYADPETGLLKGGEIACEDGKVREFDESTYAAVSKWYTDQDGNWHYLKNGLDAGGWMLINTTWYYLDPSTGVMLTGWQKIDGSWYWLECWGGMRRGWLYDGGSWYYLGGSGAMVTGWHEVSEHIYQFASSGRMYEPQMAPATDAQQRVVAAAQRVPSPGGGLCFEWVSMVFAEAGYRHVYADACDDYWWFCNNGNISDLKVGMIIAVPSHTHSYLGSIYGHVCIYIGDGKVMDNAGYGEIRVKDLYEWLAYYDTTYQPLWGWYDSVPLC